MVLEVKSVSSKAPPHPRLPYVQQFHGAPPSVSVHPDSDRARIPSTSVPMAAAGLRAEGAGLARMYGEGGGDGGEGGEGGGGD